MKLTRAIICFCLPSSFAVFLMKLFKLGELGKNVKIGFSIIYIDKITMKDGSRIGHLNYIKAKNIQFNQSVNIGNLNFIKGPFRLQMGKKSEIGNRNIITRAPIGVTYNESILSLGRMTKITANHKLDLTRSISIGNYSIIAGMSSQLWTHGYYHRKKGAGRYRVDGKIIIGDNVYVGSSCVFSHGVKVGNSITIGANSVISKSISAPGLYVNQGLRFIEFDADKAIEKLTKVNVDNLAEVVYEKKISD